MGIKMKYSDEIKEAIGNKRPQKIIVMQRVGSTNEVARELVEKGAEGSTVVVADSQYAGSGRRGRSFFSPAGVGIYMSYIFDIPQSTRNLGLLTSVAGLSVCYAIEKTCKISPKIKWPNDILIQGKKVCGILTKLITDTADNKIKHAIIGIGINVNQDKEIFPDDIKEIAGSLKNACGREIDRAQLLAQVINKLDDMLLTNNVLEKSGCHVIDELCKASCTLGTDIVAITPSLSIKGRAIGIEKDGGLIVKTDNEIMVINSGEVVNCREAPKAMK